MWLSFSCEARICGLRCIENYPTRSVQKRILYSKLVAFQCNAQPATGICWSCNFHTRIRLGRKRTTRPRDRDTACTPAFLKYRKSSTIQTLDSQWSLRSRFQLLLIIYSMTLEQRYWISTFPADLRRLLRVEFSRTGFDVRSDFFLPVCGLSLINAIIQLFHLVKSTDSTRCELVRGRLTTRAKPPQGASARTRRGRSARWYNGNPCMRYCVQLESLYALLRTTKISICVTAYH